MGALRLIFLGPPGTGKGTQAGRLSARCGLKALSSGNELRKELQAGSDVGQRARQFMQRGQLVPDAVVLEIMRAAIDELGNGAGFILDGFPRTVPQAEALDGALRDRPLDAVLDFELVDEKIVGRIAGRRVCENCGVTYNMQVFPPQVAGKCDRCGGNVMQREDDREEVVRARLVTYRAQTLPLIDYYEGRGLLHRIDAARDADAVESAIQDVLRPLERC